VTGAIPESSGMGDAPRAIDSSAVDAPRTEPVDAQPSALGETRFAHASEAEMARILDFYGVRWEYEPTTFPILWNLDGDVVESFAPDFYLPELEVFLEMTTLKQRLVRKKNRKLRRIRELYPDINIKLFYARDFRAMMLKYGRFGLFESLSGTTGQVIRERAANEVMPPATGVPIAALEPDLQAAAIVRAAPRPRPGRRRRDAGVGIETGAEREAGA
jgi:hypoxanthine phosphoribosyltransferase